MKNHGDVGSQNPKGDGAANQSALSLLPEEAARSSKYLIKLKNILIKIIKDLAVRRRQRAPRGHCHRLRRVHEPGPR